VSEYVSHVPDTAVSCILAGEQYPFGRTLTAEEQSRSRAIASESRAAVGAHLDAHPHAVITEWRADTLRYLERYLDFYEAEWFGDGATRTVGEVVARFFE